MTQVLKSQTPGGVPVTAVDYPTMSKQDDLLIRSKNDLDRAERLIEMGYPRIAPYIANLIEWIQDMNWPVAKRLAPFLATLGEPVVPEIRKVLNGDDMIWKYSCIGLIGEMDSPCVETVMNWNGWSKIRLILSIMRGWMKWPRSPLQIWTNAN